MALFLFLAPTLGMAGTLDSLSTTYQRGIHTDLWSGGLSLEKALFKGSTLRFSDAFSSSRLQVLPGVNKWKDQNQLNLDYSRALHPNWTFRARGSSYLFSDKQTGYMNDIQTHFLGAGTEYRKSNVSFPVLIGIMSDRRYERTDQGWYVQTALNIPFLYVSGYTNRLNILAEGDDLQRRKNANFSLSYLVHRQFYTDTHDSLMYSFRRQRRDYYISDAGDVESWDESGQNGENILAYRLSRLLRIRFQGGLATRTLKIRQITGAEKGFKRERRDFSYSGSARLALTTASFFSDLGFSTAGEEQQYRFAKSASYSPYSGGAYSTAPDNKSIWTTTWFNARWNWSRQDTLVLHSSLQKLQYDTPDASNVDDRDDLRFWMNLQAAHAFSPVLGVRIAADAYFLHLVYLSGQKSADNNRTHIYRFYPSVLFRPSERLRIVQTAEVLANYVDYDFDSMLLGIRSFLYRKFRLDDSLHVGLNSMVTLHLFHRIELDENGKLVWNQWLEEKLLDRKSQTFSVEASYTPFKGINLVPGYVYYRRQGFRYTETLELLQQDKVRELTQDFLSQGPTLRMLYQAGRLLWTLNLSSLRIETFSMPAQVTTRVDLNMNWRF
jgi:hypothetical protein